MAQGYYTPGHDPMNPLAGMNTQGWDPADAAMYQAMLTPAPQAPGSVQDDLERQAHGREMRSLVGPTAALGALQVGAAWMPTAQDRFNKEQLATLEAAHDQNRMADTPQAALIEQGRQQGQMAAASRAYENRMRAQAVQATMGNSTSAEAALRPGREAMRQNSTDRMAVDQNAMTGRLKEMQRQLDEAEQRRAYKSERFRENMNTTLGAGAQIAQQHGRARAGKSQEMLDPSELRAKGWTDDEIRTAIQYAYSTPTATDQRSANMLSLAAGWVR